ncbi:MAG: Magnesium and cobalt efflux protein CorC [Syntrophaceae bacterium PtaU1.Bin231]|nr:MAG: Magnesium and cobalt efflux protein CorC [Syntrophaceae bacterium PtaU1.Bin231]
MSHVSTDMIVILFLILMNGLLSMAELAVVSASKGKIRSLAEKGNRKAQMLVGLSEKPEKFLSTIQVGVTLIGILSGVYGGSTLAKDLGVYFNTLAPVRPHGEILGFLVVVVGITYLSIVIGEIVPKRWALSKPEKIGMLLILPIHYLYILLYPIVRLLSLSSEGLSKLLGIKKASSAVSEEELKFLLEEGAEAGIFHQMEQQMCDRVLRIDDLDVKDVMTPRPDITWLDLELSLEENLERIRISNHTCFPVCRGSLDRCLGFIHVKDLFQRYPSMKLTDIETLLMKPFIFPESVSALKVLEHFKSSPVHMALVIDEYGVIQGMVTVSDIMKIIVGEIPSLIEQVDRSAIRREDGSWLIDGTMSTEEFKMMFETGDLPGEEQGDYHTVAGFIMTHLGRLPVTGDHVHWGKYRFEIIDMDGNRVDKVLMNIDEKPKPEAADSPTPSDGK